MKSLTNPIYVTLSGADDNVDIEQMKEISSKYPFVEWGILLSPNNFGNPRYPSKEWLHKFMKTDLKKSLHLCGGAARVFAFEPEPMDSSSDAQILQTLFPIISKFDRVQLNLSKNLDNFNYYKLVYLFKNMINSYCDNYILQVGLGSSSIFNIIKTELNSINSEVNLLPFLDVSGGKGLEGKWKLDFDYSDLCGFAGGINSDNVTRIIQEIKNNNRNPFWIDMESGIRTNDEFDFNLVEKILNQIEF